MTRTITIETARDVTELAAHAARHGWADETRIIERCDGRFVRNHGRWNGPRTTGNLMWDDARHVAYRVGARYIGVGPAEHQDAADIQPGWFVLTGGALTGRWREVTGVTLVAGQVRIKLAWGELTADLGERLLCRQPTC